MDLNRLLNLSTDIWAYYQNKSWLAYGLNTLPHPNILKSLFDRYSVLGSIWRLFHRISPIDFRLILRTHEEYDNQALIYFARALVLRIKHSPNEHMRTILISLLELLMTRFVIDNQFRVTQGRAIYLRNYSAESNVVAPILMVWCTDLFDEVIEIGIRNVNNISLEECILDSLNYFTAIHPIELTSEGAYFNYSVAMNYRIYNASCEISGMLVRLGKKYRYPKAVEIGESGLRFVAYYQRPDGSWFYGEAPDHRYIDNFHTAYILDAFYSCITICPWLQSSFNRGLTYYIDNLFNQELYPVHYVFEYTPGNSNRFQLVDLRDFCSAIILFTKMKELSKSERLIHYMLQSLYSEKKQYFYSEKTYLWTNKIRYIEYQAWAVYSIIFFLCASQEKLP